MLLGNEAVLLIFQTRDTDAARLAEELGAAKAREAQAETRMNSEVRLLSQEMENMKKHHRDEVSLARVGRGDKAQTETRMNSEVRLTSQEMENMKKHHRDEVSWGRGQGSGGNSDELGGPTHITGDGEHEKASPG